MRIAGVTSRSRAFTFVYLIIVLGTIVALAILAGVLLPTRSSKGRAPRIKCTSNLKQVGLAFRGWAQDNDDKYPFQVPGLTNFQTGVVISSNAVTAQAWMHLLLLSNELSIAKILMCPGDRSRIQNMAEDFTTNSSPRGLEATDSRDKSVSYFVGLMAEQVKPQMILGGDRNIAPFENQPPYVAGKRSGVMNVPPKAAWSSVTGHALHDYQGNLLMADGSVQQVSASRLTGGLSDAARLHGTNANLFLFPK